MGLGNLSGFVANLRTRLMHFTIHDLRQRPIFALYFVLGILVVSYATYLLVTIAKDLVDARQTQVTAKPAAEQTQAVPEASGTRGGGAEPRQVGAGQAGSQKATVQAAASPGHRTESAGQQHSAPPAQPRTAKTATVGLDVRDWRSYDFPDGGQILFPRTWQETNVPAQQGVLYGIRLEVPGAHASIQVYAQRRQAGEDLVKTLRATMNREGARNIEEKRKKIKDFTALELSGTVADKQMAITIFDHDPDTYVVATLIATTADYSKQRPNYDAVLSTYGTPQSRNQPAGVSVRDLEQSIRQGGLQKTEEDLVGKMVQITLVNGKTQKGVVLAEDDRTYTLENYRFGGRYSFKVNKKDVAKISR
jgi:hypothetical protein